MSIKYEIKEVPAQKSLSVRTKTNVQQLPNLFGQVYGSIKNHMESNNLECAGSPFAIYYNMDMNDLDVELGFPASGSLAEKENIKSSIVPGGKVLMFTHVGPYNELEKVYGEAMAHIAQNKIETTGIVCESYPNDPAVTAPSELITEIKFYLKD